MKVMKRSQTSICKNPVKTLILFMLILALSVVATSAIIISQSVHATVEHIRINHPAVVTVRLDVPTLQAAYTEDEFHDRFGYYHLALNNETAQVIGELPYVSHFDFSIPWPIWAPLRDYIPESLGDYGAGLWEDLNYFSLSGVARPEVVYIENGFLELSLGRTFTESEMMPSVNDYPIPILISSGVATLNDLTIGSVFNLYEPRFYLPENATIPETGIRVEQIEGLWEHPYNVWLDRAFGPFEVIGIFDADFPTARHLDDFHLQLYVHNTFFVPNWIAEEISRDAFYNWQEWVNIFDRNHEWHPELNIEEIGAGEAFFVLKDLLYIESFTAAIQEVLSEFHVVRDATHVFEPLEQAMSNLNGIAYQVLIFAAGATLLILSLLITLFLRERRHEFGIYLALGERKVNIISQVLIEVLTVSVVAISLGVFVSRIVADYASREILLNEIVISSGRTSAIPSELEFRGLVRQLSVEELASLFNVSLDTQTIIIFYAVGLVAIMISTIVPIVYVLELKPKEILMQSKIG